jgi:hypothetical protein
MDNIDILVDSSQAVLLVDLDNHVRLFKMGRPFWGACLIQGGNTVVDSILKIAKSKIVGGTTFDNWLTKVNNESSLNENEAISILGSRLAINICPYSQVSHNLVSDFLALCLWISKDRRALASKMCSEPILSHASAIVYDRMNQQAQMKALDILAQSMKKGIVEAGYRGELVSRVLFILAWDSIWRSIKPLAGEINITRKVKVKTYLQHLLSESVMDSLKDWTFLDDDFWVFFTHFITLNYTPGKAAILSCMKRGAAIICRQNEWGIDLIIPMIRKSTIHSETTLLNDEDVSFILVSVNNYREGQSKADFDDASSTYKMNPLFIGIIDNAADVKLPYMTIYMDVGCPESGFISRKLQDKKASPRLTESSTSESNSLLNHNLCLFGIDQSIFNKSWLTEEILPVLVDLREARLDFRESAPLESDQSHIILSLPDEYGDYRNEISKYNNDNSGTEVTS